MDLDSHGDIYVAEVAWTAYGSPDGYVANFHLGPFAV
jgi:hypothetical protein